MFPRNASTLHSASVVSPETGVTHAGSGFPAPGSGSGSGKVGTWQPPTPQELALILPQYEIDVLLGRGGMGAVYKGRQRALDRVVAIKILPPEMEGLDQGYAVRFRNEARAMGRLSHPNIVSVHDFGSSSAGLHYFVMEFVEGTDVSRMIREQGRLRGEHVKNIVIQVCEALEYAHDKGILHRDIKPANIMVSYDGRVKVADFGLAKIIQGGDTSLTHSTSLLGTLHYMAPEALTLGEQVDARADIYSLGVMLYQMLTGKLPQGLFEMPSVRVPGLDTQFDEIVSKALREDRKQRYQTVLEMRNDLEDIFTIGTQTRRTRSSPFRFGRFQIIRQSNGAPALLGNGSCGNTYKAVHSLLGNTVALKVIHEALALDPEVKQRFLNEAQAIAKLKHPHIAQLIDCDLEGGSLFYAMEYCDGGDLERLVTSRGPLSDETVLQLAHQAARALAYVHDHGYLHRDLKPSNLMLSMVPGTAEANLKLIDFGLVKALHPDASTGLTTRGQFRGTLLYTSPEQLRGEELDRRTDVFSLGMTLWFLLVGGPPLTEASGEIAQLRREGKSHAASLPRTIHPGLRALLTKMLQPNRDRRARDMQVVLVGIEECMAQMHGAPVAPRQSPAHPLSGAQEIALFDTFSMASASMTVSRTDLGQSPSRLFAPPPVPEPEAAPPTSPPTRTAAPEAITDTAVPPQSPPPATHSGGGTATRNGAPTSPTRGAVSSPSTTPPTATPATVPPVTQPTTSPPVAAATAPHSAATSRIAPTPRGTSSASPSAIIPPPPPPRQQPVGPIQTPQVKLSAKFSLLSEIENLFPTLGPSFEAKHLRTGKYVHITRIDLSLAADEEFVGKLEHMARTASRCSEGFVIRPQSLIRFTDCLALIEEEVIGLSLLDILQERQRLQLAETSPILRQLAEACDRAADSGLHDLDLGVHHVQLQFPHMRGARIGDRDRARLLSLPIAQWHPSVVRVRPNYPATLGFTMANVVTSTSAAAPGTADHLSHLTVRYAKLVYHILSGHPLPPSAGLSRSHYVKTSGLDEEGNRLLSRVLSGELAMPNCENLLRQLLLVEGLPPAPLTLPPQLKRPPAPAPSPNPGDKRRK